MKISLLGKQVISSNLKNVPKLESVELISQLHTELQVIGGTNNGVDEHHRRDLKVIINMAKEKEKFKNSFSGWGKNWSLSSPKSPRHPFPLR